MRNATNAARIGHFVGERISGAVRPSVEALLLAAVALGCAQAGWTLLTPSNAGAASASSDDAARGPRRESVEVRSPFEPEALQAGTHAVSAALSSIELNGVRMATEPTRSGALFTLADGAQRAFLVGQEVVAGVVLTDVADDHVLFSFEGGQHRIEMAAAPSFSFARAMMGLEPAHGAPQLASFSGETAPASASPTDQAWLARTLASVETRDGRAYGWRISEDAPETAIRAGLRAGDLVLAVNGDGPADLSGLAAVGQASAIIVEIEREGQRRTITLELPA
jgi:type II secretory pathway component PulC